MYRHCKNTASGEQRCTYIFLYDVRTLSSCSAISVGEEVKLLHFPLYCKYWNRLKWKIVPLTACVQCATLKNAFGLFQWQSCFEGIVFSKHSSDWCVEVCSGKASNCFYGTFALVFLASSHLNLEVLLPAGGRCIHSHVCIAEICSCYTYYA